MLVYQSGERWTTGHVTGPIEVIQWIRDGIPQTLSGPSIKKQCTSHTVETNDDIVANLPGQNVAPHQPCFAKFYCIG